MLLHTYVIDSPKTFSMGPSAILTSMFKWASLGLWRKLCGSGRRADATKSGMSFGVILEWGVGFTCDGMFIVSMVLMDGCGEFGGLVRGLDFSSELKFLGNWRGYFNIGNLCMHIKSLNLTRLISHAI